MSLAPATTTANRSDIAARLAACIAYAVESPNPGSARVAVAEATTVGE
jgi:hypothetical protein